MKQINYVGQEYETKNYGKFKIIEDLGLHQIYPNILNRYRLLKIQWDNTGSIQIIRSCELSQLAMKDVFAKTVFNRGYLGNAKNYTKKEYDIWYNMLKRSYCKECPDYINYGAKGVHVCTRWLCFEYFLEDLRKMENYDKLIAGEKYQLDKDTLQPDKEYGKVYSPETCVLIPAYSNNAEIYRKNLDNKAVKYNGVYSNESVNENYIARIFLDGKNRNLGTYDKAIYAAAIRDEIAWMYNRLDLLNHTGITFDDAICHKCGRYNSFNISEILSTLPPREMCKIINNNVTKTMCYTINPIERGY